MAAGGGYLKRGSPQERPSSASQATFSTTEMALALNRYLCLAVLPLITKCAPLFAGTEHRAIMVDSMLHTVYRLSRGRSLTKAQRDVIEDCLMALCRWGWGAGRAAWGRRGVGGVAGRRVQLAWG